MRTLKIINASSRQVAYRTIGEIISELEEVRRQSVFPSDVKNIHNKLNSVPNINHRKEIITNLNLVHYYDELAKKLVSIKSQLTYAFKDSPEYRSTYNLVKDINKEITKSVSDTLKTLNKFCWENVPADIKKSITLIKRTIATKYKGKFFTLMDVIRHKNKNIVVHRFYLRLDNVQDDTGFVYPHYYIMLTHTNGWHINTGAFFRLIRFMDSGTPIKGATAKDIMTAISNTLTKDGI